ncbi:hypothetical protein Q7A36_09110 [Paracraurococcus sp. LOR1-02]|uniref:Uncharacterized protein n=1 Tax=Paracraurococcus lichenis TaxID=3064888 RepID=A0ABT9DX77_9PROT|nr:hypothetical protein [Paracraurococcus sp. LOR1-02]MDO9708501.1 hypothetical protein [Paracraurococcus sp. LOR1-02]
MDRNIAEGNDPRQVGDRGGEVGIDPAQSGQGLAPDLELPLHG